MTKTSKKAAQPMAGTKPRSQGLSSNKLVRPGLKLGMRTADKVSPGGVSQLGEHVGRNPESLIKGQGPQVELGNARAEACPEGVGGGRTVYKSGAQGQHGSPAYGEHNPSPHTPGTRGPKGGPLG